MRPVQRREAQSVDWVAQFDQRAFRRPHSVQSHETRFESALTTIGHTAAGSSLQQASRDGLVVLFDGLLYDPTELQRALGAPGGPAADADAALILHAYARWGEAFLDHVKGTFAVIVWDRARARLTAARDPFGEYPLFFAQHEGGALLFSTSIDALLADPRIRRTLNSAALADHLCQRWPDPTETFFAAVRRVPPGHRLVSVPSGLTTERYWHPIAPDGHVEWLREHDLDEFDARFETAAARVLSQGDSGILLSGGLDSVSVAAVATDVARQLNHSLPRAYSLSYPGPSAEEPVQRAVAAALGITQEIVPFWQAVPGASLLTETLRLNQTLPILLHSPWAPAYEHLMQLAARSGVRTLMTGAGGVEAFSLNPLFVAVAMRRGNVVAFARHLAAWRRSYRTPLSWYLKGMLWAYSVRPVGVAALEWLVPKGLNERRLRRAMAFAPSYVAPGADLTAELERRALRSFEARNTSGPLHLREVNQRLEHSLESQACEENFERGRRLGVRLKHPLRDPDLTAMVYRMPQRLIYGDGRAKYPLRRRVARRFPGLGFDRQKKLGGTGFFRSILETELPAIWSRTGLTALTQLGVVDGRRAADMVNSALRGENTRNLIPVWELLKLEAWAESRI